MDVNVAVPDRGIIIVTGSNGRIGDAVMRRFAGRFADVVGFDRKAPGPPPPGCVYVPVEITSDESVRDGLRTIREHHGAHVASVIHLAAYYDFFGKPSPKYDEITVQGTGRLLRGAPRAGLSGRAVRLLEHDARPPSRRAGRVHHRGLAARAHLGVPRVEGPDRTAHPRGARRHPAPCCCASPACTTTCTHSIPLAQQIQRINERDLTSRVYSGSTAHGQSFLHMDDLVDAIERVVERRAELPPEVPLLLGEPEALSYDELQHTIARLIRGDSKETIEIPGALAPLAKAGAWVLDHVPGQERFIKPWMIDRANDHYALDITRARTLLGWEPKRSLRETLPKMIAALKADPLGWYRENDLEPPSDLGKTAGKSDDAAPRRHRRKAPPGPPKDARPTSSRRGRPSRVAASPERRTRRDAPAPGDARWRWRTMAGRSGRTSPT